MRGTSYIGFISVAIFILSTSLFAQDDNKGKVSGYMFGDYYYEFSNPDDSLDALNQNGFQFRRIYFNYDRDINNDFSVRFRLEMKSSEGETIDPFIKNAYLAWKNLVPKATLYFGVQGTPTWGTTEKVWGYRSVSKTIMDLRKVSESSDFGLGVRGKLDDDGKYGYRVLFANGEGKKGEFNQHKKIYTNVTAEVADDVFITPYFDYEGGADDMNKHAFALFAGISKENYRFGAEAFRKTNSKAAVNGDDLHESGLSVFGALNIYDNVNSFVRYDYYDPDTDSESNVINYILAGFDFELAKGVNLMPHARIETYEASEEDAWVRGVLTFFYRF